MNTIGNYAPDFELPGIDQKVYHLGNYRRQFQAIAVVFMSDLSEVNHYIERLKQLQTDFGGQKFTVIAIDSNYSPQPIAENIKAMQKYAHARKLNFPYLRDSNQDVAKAFKTQILPTVYLLDSDAVIRYQGRIDDGTESAVNHHYLRNSVESMLAGGRIERNYVDPVGVKINWRPQ
ncbi:MAG: redoxin domain-containing protein [Pleurocapsa sp. SU_5_0]|nr:redoxin domain-containing protein [Pleurocapsa sp. SU_5_0]NJO98098.1 redoxin domain-containing protein [Pleurocapsa sp. CRU_1_2]NJR46784.1 redoxin domain-containing protein [Hyellaceae cyanobacterium CSU_1_1]